MAVDPLSPIAPARIRALLLPVGRIKRMRFLTYVDLLQQQSLVRLGDISPDPRSDRNMFSPLAFPQGTLIYDLSTSLPPPSQVALSPFEQFREPLLIIGIGDASEYAWLQPPPVSDATTDGSIRERIPEDGQSTELRSAVNDLKEQFPRAYLHSLMMFESTSYSRHSFLPRETILVPPTSHFKTISIKTIICDLTAILLAEITTLARSIQALPTIASPASQSGLAGNTPAWANADFNASQFAQRGSQGPAPGRAESPQRNAQKDQRMSMPVLPSGAGVSLNSDDRRSVSPGAHGMRSPPTTIDDISNVSATNALHQTTNTTSKPSSSGKDPAADRVSIHGFGSGGVGERARNKGRGRVSIVIGTLYMCAGQWHDALRELTDGANRARVFGDHLWQGKALEHIMVCLLLFAWSGMDVQIPQICYPITDKSAGMRSPPPTAAGNPADAPMTSKSNRDVVNTALNSLLPELVNMILNLYTRASNFQGESLPPLPFSECVIRFSKLLATMNLAAGSLDKEALESIVEHKPYRGKSSLSALLHVHPTRYDIASMLFRALPGPAETAGMNATDRVVVLAGIASVLSSLRLQRKKAIVIMEFISSLIPGLVQARKVGAAEMGLHPAAGLAALGMVNSNPTSAGTLNFGESEVENGIDDFLGLLSQAFGIPQRERPSSPAADAAQQNDSQPQDDSREVIKTIVELSSLRSYGCPSLKVEVLRLCLSFCEALPDFNGVLQFTAALLRVAGPGTAPRANSTDVHVSLPREEQARLYSNISRTVAAAKKLGLRIIEADYWDDFLVRGFFMLPEATTHRLTRHQTQELKATRSKKNEPFLHSPWRKKPLDKRVDTVLVANEGYQFVISLQNPYDFELEIESLRVASTGINFVASVEHFLLGPYRTQKFQIMGKADAPGTLQIFGCYIKLVACREQLFPVFVEPWQYISGLKLKSTGMKACLEAPMSRPKSAGVFVDKRPGPEPKPEHLTFSVIHDQPMLAIASVSLPQSAVMVLEGEVETFTITVKNTSTTTIVDFVHISFQDSATSALQSAISNKDLPAAELHEFETQLAEFPALRWSKSFDEETIRILPGETMNFTIEVVGRIHLNEAVIQINYANLGRRRSEIEDQFFTRQVSVPISITVNASVQLQRSDIIPITGDVASFDIRSQTNESLSIITQTQSLEVADANTSEEFCMLLLDLRNSWPNPLSITLQMRRKSSDTEADRPWENAQTIDEIIQPGHVNRVVMIIPKFYLANAHVAVPSLNAANQRQFIVSTSKISSELERANREAFWYRHELLKLIRGTWKEESSKRHGDLELRSIRLNARTIDAIKLEDIKIDMCIEPCEKTSALTADQVTDNTQVESTPTKRLTSTKFQIPVDSFLTLKTTIHNRTMKPVLPLLRLQPHLAGVPHTIALDLDKRFSWTGVLQRNLPAIPPGSAITSELGVVALCSGAFEISATVDEVEIADDENEGQQRRERADSQMVMEGELLGGLRLRRWCSREACLLIARRVEEA